MIHSGIGTDHGLGRKVTQKDWDLLELRRMILAGAESKPSGQADHAYFAALRQRVDNALRGESANHRQSNHGGKPRALGG